MAFTPRPAQSAVLGYQSGRMAVSAVPGSGKTHILSHLAAELVSRGLGEDQEVLIVTFANSAVGNFVQRITGLIRQEYELLPHLGYRVRTLHGLAHDIVRERPSLVGLAEDFSILDERLTAQMRQDATLFWLRGHPEVVDSLIAADVDERSLRRIHHKQWPDLAFGIADRFVSRAKDLQLTPASLRLKLSAALEGETGEHYALAHMCLEVYEDYQRALTYRGGVDFDDLIRLALEILQSDSGVLGRLRYRWPYILEDEAQDSSYLQEKILRLLTEGGNWVRVGDPNQAINTTFTTANPHFLRQFLEEDGVESRILPDSGRSTLRIIDLANHLVEWTCEQHPTRWLRSGPAAAFFHQLIKPTAAGDPQPNPQDTPDYVVRLHDEPYAPDVELRTVVRSLAKWLPAHPDSTVAVLVPANDRGFKLAELLRTQTLPYEELLRSTARTREAAAALETVLRFVAYPLRSDHLGEVYRVWDQALKKPPANGEVQSETDAAGSRSTELTRALRRCRQTESFLYPRPDADWLAELPLDDDSRTHLLAFRESLQRWLSASILPIDQLILTLAQELFAEPSDLALAYKLALVLRAHTAQHPDARLPELADELALIARNQRRFLGFDDADLGYTPKRGIITVSTMHRAKGLEWDRVYLLGVNNYDFPAAEPHDYYRGESWFVRDQLNLEAEAIAQLETLHDQRLHEYVVGEATEKARIDYAAERLRLLYVGITRAKKELIITWNTGHTTFGRKQPAAAFTALHTYWEQGQAGPTSPTRG